MHGQKQQLNSNVVVMVWNSRGREVSYSTRNHAETQRTVQPSVPVQQEPVLLLLAARTGRGVVVHLYQLREIVLYYFSHQHCRTPELQFNFKSIAKLSIWSKLIL